MLKPFDHAPGQTQAIPGIDILRPPGFNEVCALSLEVTMGRRRVDISCPEILDIQFLLLPMKVVPAQPHLAWPDDFPASKLGLQ